MLARKQGKHDEAERLLREAARRRARTLGASHPRTLISEISVASVLREKGDGAAAEKIGRDVVARAKKALPAGHWYLALFEGELAKALALQGKYAAAEEVALRAHATLRGALGDKHRRTREAAQCLEQLYAAWDKAEPNRPRR